MNLRTLIGLVLLLAGTAIVLYGLGAAIMELVHLYGSALSDPMADTPGIGAERGVSDRMIRSVIIGAIGVPPMVIGSVMLGMGLFGLMRRLLSPKAAPAGKKKARV